MALADWGKKLGSIAQSTVEKSKELTEITKANLVISNAEENIRNCQIRIGEYVMQNNLLREDAVLAEIYMEVDANRETIAAHKEKIEEIKSANICKSCGAEMGKAVRFCSACGAERQAVATLEAPVVAAAASIRCANCGVELEGGASFCASCGSKVEEQ